MSLHLQVGLAVLGVFVVAYFAPSDDPTEIIWTILGAIGAVYHAHIWHRRLAADRWRRSEHLNGLFALTTQAHVVLRGCGFIMSLLVLTGGVGAMLNWNRLLILGSLIGLAALLTFSAWYAERMADRQTSYHLMHPEE